MAYRILLVDDEPELLQALSVRLSHAGFVCDTATNGKDALAMLQQDPLPDLIIVDLLMPIVSGYEVCRRLKDDARTTNVPVVVLTAIPERSLQQAQSWLHATTLLHKPFDSKKLVATVCDVLHVPSPGG